MDLEDLRRQNTSGFVEAGPAETVKAATMKDRFKEYLVKMYREEDTVTDGREETAPERQNSLFKRAFARCVVQCAA